MPKSRHRKKHKQKVQARTQKIKDARAKHNKMQREFLMNLIKKEQESGLFDNNPTISPVGPSIDGPILDGPILDGPAIDVQSLDNTSQEINEGPSI